MRLLFAKHSLAWPRSTGHDVHAFHMMKACAELGHEVSLATVLEPSAAAMAGLPLKAWFPLEPHVTHGGVCLQPTDSSPEGGPRQGVVIRRTRLQERFQSFYGVPDSRLVALARATRDSRADAVVVVGLDGLPYFPALPSSVVRVWYAADEWIWHHLSQLKLGEGTLRANLRDATVKGVYERAHRRLVDRVWVVSETERRAMRWLAGMAEVDVLPNGVDGEYFCPSSSDADAFEPRTAVFWGRLDFGPNVQALEWFFRKVWPLVRARVPDARFTIIGFRPSDSMRRLASGNGISLVPDLEDLRTDARRHALAVLPFVSGGGIKNKLLEAAALGLPIVCTPTATAGLRSIERSHLLVTSTPDQMCSAIVDVWTDADRRRQLGAAVRGWVLKYHTWTATAREAVAALEPRQTKVAEAGGVAEAEARTQPVRVGFVLHSMQVAGAEVLVAETIRRLGGRIAPVVFCLDEIGALGERMRSEGVEVVAFGRRPGVDLTIVRRMAREIRSRRLEVLHAHQYTPFFYGALAAKLSGVRPRVVFTEHGRHYPDVVSAKRRLANRLVFDRLADHVNAVCRFSAQSLSDRDGFRAGRIQVIENGVDLTRYSQSADLVGLRRRLGLDPSRRYITNVARFHPVKDHRTLLHAFSDVARARADVDLLLVGDGGLRDELEALVTDLGLAGRVHFMGVRNDVPDILRAVDLFALTSLSEAASITLLEAMAAGLPVVVTAVGGNPELVRDGIDGLLAPRGDRRAIASAILRVLDDADLARAMGKAGGERVRTLFRIDRTIERYYELYAVSRELSVVTCASTQHSQLNAHNSQLH